MFHLDCCVVAEHVTMLLSGTHVLDLNRDTTCAEVQILLVCICGVMLYQFLLFYPTVQITDYSVEWVQYCGAALEGNS